ncbi:PAS domain-containing sensor histidine kinase [Halosimplex aquaticum]|uniref:histidine kinase n=1 Tax=Halosimplex aquaticum TaxID=3026162 RepID=A0ABD5Y7F9_9EURY|nr:PAS domain-containing sensor histidine kinase [Halosimplex aquaticum]
MHTAPTVLYVGPNARSVADAWDESGEELAVESATPPVDVAGMLADGRYDAVVCDSDGSFDGPAVVEAVREYSKALPVFVLAADDSFPLATATEFGVATYLQVDADTDRVATLERLRPAVERRREERRESTMLDSLLENVPLSIYIKDRRSRHVRVSDGALGLNGPPYLESPDGKRHHTPADLIGKTDWDLYPPTLSEGAVADDRHVVETGESIEDRIEQAYGDDLEETYVTTSKAPWRDEHGNVLGIVGVTRDVTDRKKYEKQLERQNERLERFASVISHDLRNPLEVALGRLEFARADGDEEHFDALERSLYRIDDLIDDVLTLAREGETVSDPEPTDLASVAREAWKVVETPEASLDVRTDATLLADGGRLQQLLENVFRNAVEHGSTGPPSHAPEDAVEHGSASHANADASADPGERAGPGVTVTVGDLDGRQGFFVADDGPGIPEGDRDSVFDSGYSTSDDGTGLGLSIVRTIAEAHGWEVDVTESERSRGARFEFGEVGDAASRRSEE